MTDKYPESDLPIDNEDQKVDLTNMFNLGPYSQQQVPFIGVQSEVILPWSMKLPQKIMVHVELTPYSPHMQPQFFAVACEFAKISIVGLAV